MKRLPLTSWRVAAMLARRPGWRFATLRTRVPSMTREVASAIPVSVTRASGTRPLL